MKIGELAERSGLAASAIRYYEQQGLLPKASRSANGYRVYSETSLERLHLIQIGQNLGFALDTIRGVLSLEGMAYQDSLMQKLDARLEEIDRMMATLSNQRETLQDTKRKLNESGLQGLCSDKSSLVKVTMSR